MDYQTLLRQIYHNFNARRIDAVLAHMHKDVSWPNGWEGGYVTGHDEVRAYWLRQWQQIDPVVEPIAFEEKPDGRIAINVRQDISEKQKNLIEQDFEKHKQVFLASDAADSMRNDLFLSRNNPGGHFDE